MRSGAPRAFVVWLSSGLNGDVCAVAVVARWSNLGSSPGRGCKSTSTTGHFRSVGMANCHRVRGVLANHRAIDRFPARKQASLSDVACAVRIDQARADGGAARSVPKSKPQTSPFGVASRLSSIAGFLAGYLTRHALPARPARIVSFRWPRAVPARSWRDIAREYELTPRSETDRFLPGVLATEMACTRDTFWNLLPTQCHVAPQRAGRSTFDYLQTACPGASGM